MMMMALAFAWILEQRTIFFGCVIGYGYQQHVYNVHTVKSAWLTVNCIHPTPTLPPLHINHQKIVVSSRLSIAAVRVTD